MTTWTSDELSTIGGAEEVQLASLRRDGTRTNPVTIWVVRHGDDLYVRSVKGRTGAWFRGTQERHEGRIWAGGVQKDVTFVEGLLQRFMTRSMLPIAASIAATRQTASVPL